MKPWIIATALIPLALPAIDKAVQAINSAIERMPESKLRSILLLRRQYTGRERCRSKPPALTYRE